MEFTTKEQALIGLTEVVIIRTNFVSTIALANLARSAVKPLNVFDWDSAVHFIAQNANQFNIIFTYLSVDFLPLH